MSSSVSCSLQQLQSVGTYTPIREIDKKLYDNFHFVISTNTKEQLLKIFKMSAGRHSEYLAVVPIADPGRDVLLQ